MIRPNVQKRREQRTKTMISGIESLEEVVPLSNGATDCKERNEGEWVYEE